MQSKGSNPLKVYIYIYSRLVKIGQDFIYIFQIDQDWPSVGFEYTLD